MNKQDILGYGVEAGHGSEVVSRIVESLDEKRHNCCWLACLNPHSYAMAKQDDAFRCALQKADWLVPDGVGVVVAGRILKRPLTGRITGFDIFDGVMRGLNLKGGSVFFLGGTEATLKKIEEKLPQDYPNVILTGTYSPPFKPEYPAEEINEMVAAISLARPDVLWVGMTAPKQEKWIAELQEHLNVSFAGAVGAVFDFYTGNVKRSHPAFQKMGLEWLPRLMQQPQRLWRRMFISAPIFMRDVFFTRFKPSR